MSAATKKIPVSVVRRLPKYHAYVQKLRQGGIEWVSSRELAERLDLTSSTVRQDLSHLDFSGVSKRGYSTLGLEQTLAQVLGADEEVRIVIVGAGNLGRALALHGEFRGKSFRIAGIFDSDPRLFGEKVGALDVQPMWELPDVVRREAVDLGIIAVPAIAAQEVADRLVLAGVQGLLNLAHLHVIAPRSVPVVDARITASLQELCYAVKVNPNARRAWRTAPSSKSDAATAAGEVSRPAPC